MSHQKSKFSALLILIAFSLSLLLGACAAPAMMSDSNESYAPMPGAPPMEESESFYDGSGGGEYQKVVDSATVAQSERIVIKNASMSLSVSDPSASMDAIAEMAEEMGGFVVSANMYKQELANGIQVPRASISVRVPAEKLNQALAQIKAESEQTPLNESIDSQDVTNEYVDLQSRLKNLEATEVKLAEIMDEANKTEDVLSVYNPLVQVREQIEVMKGQIKYYQEAAAMSSVSVELLADEAVQPLTIGGWQPVGVAKNAIQALIDTLEFLVNAVIWIVIYILPVLLMLYLIFVLPLTLLLRVWRKRRRARKAAEVMPLAKKADE